jgi:NHL repeat
VRSSLRAIAVAAVAFVATTPIAVAGSTATGTIATIAELNHPRGLAVMADGGILVAQPFKNVVSRVTADGTIATVAGDGRAAFGGDGGLAAAAQLDFVHGVAPMPDGGFVLADTLNLRIRRVRADGTIVTVGDQFADPRGVATFPDGRILVPDTGNNRVRLIRPDGTTITLAGNGTPGFSGDGGPATAAQLNNPFGVAPLADGGFLVDDSGNNRIRRVWPNGTITTVAGDGVRGFAGDGGPATAAELNGVHNVLAVDAGFLIADTENHRVRLVRRDGTISTIVGNGTRGFGGDGGPATGASLNEPKAVVVTRTGSLIVADASNDRLRAVDAGLLPVPSLTLRPVRTSMRIRTGRRAAVAVRVNFPATITLTVRRGSAVLARVSSTGRAGVNTLVVARRARRGRYLVQIAARRGDGATARASVRLTVTR